MAKPPKPIHFWGIRCLALTTFIVDITAGLYYIIQFNNTSDTCYNIYIAQTWDSYTFKPVCDQTATDQCENTKNCFASTIGEIGYCSGCSCCVTENFFTYFVVWMIFTSFNLMREGFYVCAAFPRLKRLTTMNQSSLYNLSPCFFSYWLMIAPFLSDSYSAVMAGFTSGTYLPRPGYIFLEIFSQHIPSITLVIFSYKSVHMFPPIYYLSLTLSAYSIFYKLLALRRTMKSPSGLNQQINITPSPSNQYGQDSSVPIPGIYTPTTVTYATPVSYTVQGAPPPTYGAPPPDGAAMAGGAPPPPPSYGQAVYGQAVYEPQGGYAPAYAPPAYGHVAPYGGAEGVATAPPAEQ